MGRIAFFGLVVVSILVIAAEWGGTQAAPPNETVHESTDESSQPTPSESAQSAASAWLAEIFNIRQANGSVLRGTLLEGRDAEADAAIFASAFEDLRGQSQPTSHPDEPLSRSDSSASGSVFPTEDLPTLLRITAHRLEGEAFRREMEGGETEAKRLRRLARRLRNEARHIATPSP